MREPGYYWVKQEDTWFIAEWGEQSSYGMHYWNWRSIYDTDGCSDAYFEEIDERRIMRVMSYDDNAKQ